jgi:MYXO-CTERM domain-containing protein
MHDARKNRGEQRTALLLAGRVLPWLAGLVLGCGGGESSQVSGARPTPAPAVVKPTAHSTPQRSWTAEVTERIAAGEYRIRSERAGFTASNRAQRLAATWTEQGLSVASRPAAARDQAVGLRAIGVGRGQNLRSLRSRPFQLGDCRSADMKDEKGECLKAVQREIGDLVEWWENRPAGLHHGFVVSRPPRQPRSRRDWLRIEVGVSGARPELVDGSAQAVLVRRDGQRLLYAGLAAWDADQKELPVRMRKGSRSLSLEIDDTGAKYPIVVDPVLTALGWTTESNQADAGLEIAVSGAGDVNRDGFDDVLVGFPRFNGATADEGRVFLYLGGPGGPDTTSDWDVQGADAAGTAAAVQTGSLFGRSVAAAGDVNNDGFADVIIGQTNWTNGETSEGRAYVFHGSAGTPPLPLVPNWVAEGGLVSGLMGRVSTAGDINNDGFDDVVVGSPATTGVLSRIFVYLGSATGLAVPASPAQTITSAAVSERLGFSVSSAGDVNGDGRDDVIAGATTFTNGQASEGGVFAYLGQADGTLQLMPGFPFETNEVNASITAVAGVGDVNGDGFSDAVAGSASKDNGDSDEGVVFFFPGSAAGLSTSPTIIESNSLGSSFGQTVAGPGDVNGDGYADIAVGAYRFSNGSFGSAGAVFLIPGSAAGPSITNASLADTILLGAAAADNLGNALGAAGDVNGDGYADLTAGANGVDNGETNEGRAFIYLGSGNTTGLRSGSDFNVEAGVAGANLGRAVTNAGDLNGDGFADLVLAAPAVDRVLVYLGGPGGPDGTADGDLNVAAGGSFGEAIAAGDVNGDGFGDLAIGAPNFGDGQVDEGRLFLYMGSAGGITAATVPLTFDSNLAGALLGTGLGMSDVNGDGLADVVAGAPGFANGQPGEGRVFLFLGTLAGVAVATPNATVESDVAMAAFGSAVAGAGDVNGDGLGDVVIGAPGYSNGEAAEGRIYVYHGGASGFSTTVGIRTEESDSAGAALGAAVDGAGDVNGDGFADVVAGAPNFSDGEGEEGAIFVYHGSGSSIGAAALTVQSNVAGANLGFSVSGAGSLNGDAFGDVAAGAPGFASPDVDEGAVFVFVSTGTGGLPAAPSLTVQGNVAGVELGGALAGAGDVNGDGASDLVIGSPTFSSGEAAEGRVLLHLGNNNGRPFRLRAQRPGSGTLVQPRGVAVGSQTAFDVTMFASSPLGIKGVRLEVEVKPLGTAFNGAGTIADGGFTSTGLTGVSLTRNVTGLSMRTPYHYRARLQYDPATTLRARTGPWIYGGPLGHPLGVHVRTDGIGLGTVCTTAAQCGSGFCIDGVCCATTCGDGVTTDCQACSMAAGGSLMDGLCGTRTAGGSCSDGNSCTTTDTCQAGGVCQAGPGVVCAPLTQCHDVGVCEPATGMCTNPLKANGAVCDDGNMCTGGETCQAGVCSTGTATICPATDSCHDPGVCDPATGTCTNPLKANGSSCNDSNLCTQTDICQAGVCTGSNPVVCPTPDQCHDPGTCAPATGMCTNPPKADGTACNDSDMCTTMDRCMAGTCVTGGALDCNDNNNCTTDTCVAASGCVRTAVVGCVPTDGGVVDAGTDATTDSATDRPLDAVTDGARDATDSRPVDAVTDARDGAAADTRDAQVDRTPDTVVTDAARDTRDGPSTDGAAIKRVGGGGGCDCDVGTGGRKGNVQAPLALLGLALIWMRRRRRR